MNEEHVSPSLAAGFAELVSQMPRLKEFVLYIPKSATSAFASEFRSYDVFLPNVETLAATPTCEFLFACCPVVSSLLTYGRHNVHKHDVGTEDLLSFFKAAATAARKLVHVGLEKYVPLDLGMIVFHALCADHLY